MDAPMSTCQAITTYLEKKKEYPRLPIPGPKGSYVESEKCGCRYCTLACAVYSDNVAENTVKNQSAVARNSTLVYKQASTKGNSNGKDDVVHVEFAESGLVFEGGGGSTEVFVTDRGYDPIIPVASSISGYTGSDESFMTAIEWFKNCVKEHRTLCSSLITATGQFPSLPDRLIDVVSPSATDVKLVETAGQLGHYACLSHSWGGLQPLRTTLEPDTLADFKKGIEWSQLPRTFQDAVVVARKFGIQYLWIDSLCIIQDSPEDWRVQSALMAKIYQNAVITIAGSASSNPHQGLFREAEKAHVNFPSSCLEKEEGLDNVRTRKPLMHDVYQLPLMKRGWVFQERLLSSRYIHFGHNELIWECMEHITCECGCLRTREASGYEWLEPKNRLHPDSLQHLMRLPNRLTAAWRAAVVDYSRMILSYPEDIFPAISGIAKSVIEAAGWQYVAGMWKETLITDLVWRTEKPAEAQRCEEWRAPTFSWASVTGVEEGANPWITYAFMDKMRRGLDETDHSARTDVYAAVVETKCEPLGKDLTGQLKSCFIVLRGMLIKANLRHRPGHALGKWCIAPSGKEPLSNSFFFPDINFNSQTQNFHDNDVVYCLKLIGTTQTVNTINGEYLLYLVLRLEDQVEGTESRLGREDDRVFERVALLQDARGPEEVRLEDGSEESAIEQDTLVKIV